MSANAVFAGTPRIGAVTVSTANTNRDGTGTIATVFTAGSSGSRIDRLILQATGDPADSVVTLFLYDGSTYYLWNEVDLGNPAAGSTTVSAFRTEFPVYDLNLPSGWSLRAAITVALTSGVINVIALGADY